MSAQVVYHGDDISVVIPRLWSQSLVAHLDHNSPQYKLLQARRAELAWLRASLEADCLPDWCIEMVMEGW